jgi:hypothetical protein
MVYLNLSSFIHASPEDVYTHVTEFGKDGPVSEEAFRARYGNILSRDGDVFVTQEIEEPYVRDEGDDWEGDDEEDDWEEDEEGPEDDEDDYEDEGGERITWRCTFEYPTRRVMEALDSDFSHREDTFRPVGRGTMWDIRLDTRVGGLHGIVYYINFLLVGRRKLRRDIVEPVRRHFEG